VEPDIPDQQASPVTHHNESDNAGQPLPPVTLPIEPQPIETVKVDVHQDSPSVPSSDTLTEGDLGTITPAENPVMEEPVEDGHPDIPQLSDTALSDNTLQPDRISGSTDGVNPQTSPPQEPPVADLAQQPHNVGLAPTHKHTEELSKQPGVVVQTDTPQTTEVLLASPPTDMLAPSIAEQPVAKHKSKLTKIPAPTTGLRRSTRVKTKPAWMSDGHWQLLQK
jgi:hypothetical protein